MIKKRKLVVGDIHGSYLALKECLNNCKFNPENDQLISLGDICDGWSDVYEVVELLIQIPNKIVIRGNHDDVFINWMNTGKHVWHWLQGAIGTLESYVRHAERDTVYIRPHMGGYTTNLTYIDIPESHRDFFASMKYYHVTEDNKLFVHGGFNRHFDIDDPTMNSPNILIWDRDLWGAALSYEALYRGFKSEKGQFKNKNKFEEIYIGHTATTNYGNDYPMRAANIWNMDTGAGFNGRLSIIDIDTKQVWQSSPVKELYHYEKGRN